MDGVAEEFEDNFERFKNQSANRIRCLMDIGPESFQSCNRQRTFSFIYNHDQRQTHQLLALTNKISAIMDKKYCGYCFNEHDYSKIR